MYKKLLSFSSYLKDETLVSKKKKDENFEYNKCLLYTTKIYSTSYLF